MRHSALTIFAFLFFAACTAPEKPVEHSPDNQETSFNSSAAWNEFEDNLRLFYAYLERDDFDVEAHLSRTKTFAKKARTKEAFRSVLHTATYAFTDPHFIVGPFTDEDYNIIPTSSDIWVTAKGTDFIVSDVRAESAADKAGVRSGWVIASSGGTPIHDIISDMTDDIVPASTVKQRNYSATLIANGKRAGSRQLVFQHGGKTIDLILPSPRIFAREVNKAPILNVSKDNEIGIIRFNNSLGNNETVQAFDEAISELKDVGGLIIDMRNTPSGGNTEVARSIIGHFVKQTQSYQVHEIPSLEREFTVPRRFIEQVKPRAPYYDARRVVVLGGHWTGSMGEGLVIGLHGAAGVHTIASDMGDLLGALRNIDLNQSGARMDLGSEALFHINGTRREDFIADTPLENADRAPDGSDPAMVAAKAYLEK